MFKDFFGEERRIRNSKKRKRVVLDYQILLLKNEGFEVLKTEKDFLVLENLGKTLWIIGFLFIKDEYFNIHLEVVWNIHHKSLRQKGQIYLPMQEVSSGYGGWPKKLELVE